MTITEECFQRGIYTRWDIYTKISVILPGTKAALVLVRSGVSATQSEDISRPRDFVFVRTRGGKRQENRRVGGLYFQRERVTRERSDKKGALSLSLSLIIACFMKHTSRHRDEAPARSASNASTRVHPRDTHVRTDEAWHTHVRDECVLETWALFPRELRVDERGKGANEKKSKEDDKGNERGREIEEGKRSACFCVKEFFFNFFHPRRSFLSALPFSQSFAYTLLNIPFYPVKYSVSCKMTEILLIKCESSNFISFIIKLVY